MEKVLAIGDCNTLGVAECIGNSYPERFGHVSGMPVRNCGCTMATTREGLKILEKNITDDVHVSFRTIWTG